MTRAITKPLVALLISAFGVGFVGCAAIATHEEYSAYRSVRMAESDRNRLIAMQEYVSGYPTGYWTDEVQADRDSREELLWTRSNTTREGLEWYLRIYPDGTYVDRARPRLAALQTVSGRRDDEAERQRALEEQQRAELAEQRRTWVTRAVQFWTEQMIGIRNYGTSIRRVVTSNSDFNRAFGQAPEPTCTAEYCIKHYGQLYHIPVPGATRIDRTMDVYLRLVLTNGRVERTELLLPGYGFSRWYEMENQTVVTNEDPEQRMTAINWALDRIQPVIERVARGASRIDFVAEPIEALQIHQEAQDTEAAPLAPDVAAPAPTPKQDGSPEDPEAGEEGSDLNELLDQAGGGVGGEEAPPPEEVPPPTPQVTGETMVLPVNLISFRVRNVRVVVFAAGEEDYDQGFDGIFVERIRD